MGGAAAQQHAVVHQVVDGEGAVPIAGLVGNGYGHVGMVLVVDCDWLVAAVGLSSDVACRAALGGGVVCSAAIPRSTPRR